MLKNVFINVSYLVDNENIWNLSSQFLMVKEHNNNSKIGDNSNRSCCALHGKYYLCFGAAIVRMIWRRRSADYLNSECFIFLKFIRVTGNLHCRINNETVILKCDI